MYKKIFVDANILIDIFNQNRLFHPFSLSFYRYCVQEGIPLFTSCDIITTIYYIDSKEGKQNALLHIEGINKILKIIPFSNKEVADTCALMGEDARYDDLEDTLQYVLAKREGCDLIVSNDDSFYAADIEVMTSRWFCEKVGVLDL